MDQQMDEVLLKADMGNPDIIADPSFGRFDRLTARLPHKAISQSRKLKNGFEKLKVNFRRTRDKGGHDDDEQNAYEIAARGVGKGKASSPSP